jgi:AcrR family transcriptional regulator
MKSAGTRNRTYPERQEAILKAACGVFVRDGFHSASMKDICAAAGMSPGSVYRYYPSKDALIEALIEADQARWTAAMMPMLTDFICGFQKVLGSTTNSNILSPLTLKY